MLPFTKTPRLWKAAILVVSIARQIFNFQRSDFFATAEDVENQLSAFDDGKTHLRFLRVSGGGPG